MELWGWVLLYVLAFTLLQLLVYRYLRRSSDSGVPGPAVSGDPEYRAGDPRPPRELDRHDKSPTDGTDERTGAGESNPTDEGQVRCPHCRTINDRDSMFTYCEQCVRPLSG